VGRPELHVIPNDVPLTVEQRSRPYTSPQVHSVIVVVRPLGVELPAIPVLEVEPESARGAVDADMQKLERLPVVLDSAVERELRLEAYRGLDPDLADRPGRSQVDGPADGVLRPARPRRVVVA